MKAYGYISGSDAESPSNLSEVSLLLSINEIEQLIEFLKSVKEEHSKIPDSSGFSHTHFKDWKKYDNNIESDFIIVTQN